MPVDGQGAGREQGDGTADLEGAGPAAAPVEPFKLSNDKRSGEKLTDVAGLYYLNPPDQAVASCMDEKSQIHAYPGDDPGACDDGQQVVMTGSGSSADGLSGVGPQQRQSTQAKGHLSSEGADLAVTLGPSATAPNVRPGPVAAASLTDASASVPPATTPMLPSASPDNQALAAPRPRCRSSPAGPGR